MLDLGRTFLPCVLGVNGVGRGGMCSGRNAVGGKVDLGAMSRTSHSIATARLKSCDLTRPASQRKRKNERQKFHGTSTRFWV